MRAVQRDLPLLNDAPFLQTVTKLKRRPNVIVVCAAGCANMALEQMRAFSRPPVHICRLPGALELPDGPAGTVFLHDVAALMPGQQICLFDWLTDRGDVQVVSLTEASLFSEVQAGRFHEGLFYRLNTVSAETVEHPVRRP